MDTALNLVAYFLEPPALAAAAAVSRAWRRAVDDEALWRRQTIARAQRGHDDADLEPAVARCAKVDHWP